METNFSAEDEKKACLANEIERLKYRIAILEEAIKEKVEKQSK